jgi:glucose-1-phosphate cytidylyltransferase
MKVVILAGGFGTRLSEETEYIPKPVLMIGEKPILHHIMDIYMKFGFNDFIIAGGYKIENILGYFMKQDTLEVSKNKKESTFLTNEYSVTVVDTGLESQTGGRLKELAPYLKSTFMMTYGDGLANIKLDSLLAFHSSRPFANGSFSLPIVTMTSVRPVPRFGTLEMNEETGNVISFSEKSKEGLINGGFFVFEPEIFNHIPAYKTNLEKDVFPTLIGNMYSKYHSDFWKCIDTKRDLDEIREIYNKDGAVWLKY